jgi:hypothetical protein
MQTPIGDHTSFKVEFQHFRRSGKIWNYRIMPWQHSEWLVAGVDEVLMLFRPIRDCRHRAGLSSLRGKSIPRSMKKC